MKKLSIFIVGLIVSLLSIINVHAATNPYVQKGPYGTNCTWYAWKMAYEKAGVVLPGWGNANTWVNHARLAGYSTGTTPKSNSIAVWNLTEYGHVTYIERVEGNTLYMWDSSGTCKEETPEFKECLKNSPSEEGDRLCYQNIKRKDIACEQSTDYSEIIGYIYLDVAPKKPTTNNITTNNSTTQTPVAKSNNAYLSSLTISNVDFEFKKDTLKYELEVDNKIDKVSISATAENNKAKVTGTKEYDLEVGSNTINIVVTAEDVTKKTYTLEIIRKDNNAYLSNITISNIDFLFDREKFHYELEVENEIDKITIDAIPESDEALVNNIQEYELKIGSNTIEIGVTAEDGTNKTYTITIERKESIHDEYNKNEPIKRKNDTKKIILYSSIGASVLIVSILSIIFVIKKHSKKNNK